MAYSVTNFALSYQGKLKNSLAGRDDGLVLQGVNAVDNGDGTVSYQKNTAVTENIYTYYQSYKWVRDNGRENTFSTDFLKFKELRIDYQLPKHLMAKTRFLQGALDRVLRHQPLLHHRLAAVRPRGGRSGQRYEHLPRYRNRHLPDDAYLRYQHQTSVLKLRTP